MSSAKEIPRHSWSSSSSPPPKTMKTKSKSAKSAFSRNTPNKPLTPHQMNVISPAPKKKSRELRRTKTDPASASLNALKAHARVTKLANANGSRLPKASTRSSPRRCNTLDDSVLQRCRRRSSNGSTRTATTVGSTCSHSKTLDCSDHCGRMIPGPSVLKKPSTSKEGNHVTDDSSTRRATLAMRVSFDITETREYPLLFDDSRHDGPAMLTLGWTYQTADVSTVRDFDSRRSYHRQTTKGSVRVWQPAERIGLLLEAGYQLRELTIDQPQQQDQHDSEYIQETLKTMHPKKKSKLLSKVKKAASKAIVRTTRRRSMEV